MKPIVSIITPTYNHENYIRQCIESVISQKFQNWEQIIIDDNSQDKTYEIAVEYSKKDKRINVVKHNKNWGINKLADIYNQALKISKGKYIAILEGDDYWPKEKLEKQIRSFSNKKVVFSFGDCVMTNVKRLPIKLFSYNYNKKLLNNNPTGVTLTLFAKLNFSIIPCTVIIKKDTLVSIGGFVKDKYYPFVDLPTFLHLSLKGNFSYQNNICGFYRKQQDSSWFNFAKNTSAMGKEEVQKCVSNFLKKYEGFNTIGKILKDKEIFFEQNNFIYKKKFTKNLSLFLNYLAFHSFFNPLVIIFVFQYILYRIKKRFI